MVGDLNPSFSIEGLYIIYFITRGDIYREGLWFIRPYYKVKKKKPF